MTDIILETVRALVLLVIVVFLLNAGWRNYKTNRSGWSYIVAGFCLLLFGSALDITDNFDDLSHFLFIGDTQTEAFLEKFVGFLGGFCFLAYGLIKWIPSVHSLTDEIHERKRAQAALQLANKELKNVVEKEKELNEVQRQFILVSSHEFRTPLATIDMTAQRLISRFNKDLLTPEDAANKVKKIRSSVARMMRLMESNLAIARMEEGMFNTTIENCDIGKVIQEVSERHQDIAPKHIISCDLKDLPEIIQADVDAIEHIFTNLISNAIKYAPDAFEIDVIARTEGPHVAVSVRDRGKGIDQDDLHKIGERFFRAKTSIGVPGTGIGLNLTKTLIKRHGGTLNCESAAGEGSTFTVRLPIAGPDLKEQPETKAA